MLTDEEIMDIRNRAKLNDNRQIDPMAFARDIERAVLEKVANQNRDATGRSFQDYAIEHAEYLATSAEQLLNHLNECTNIDDGVIEPDENYSDYTSGLRISIHDFRKRSDRAICHPQPAQAATIPEGWRLVPIEPTLKMQTAGLKFVARQHQVRDLYKSMLSASPDP